MDRANIVIKRYTKPSVAYGVHYTTEDGFPDAKLVSEENLEIYFELGNEIEFTIEDIWNQIPMEWKNNWESDDEMMEFMREHVKRYDTIKFTPPAE